LPKASRGFLNVGTGTGGGKLIERLDMELEPMIELKGIIDGIEPLQGNFSTMNVLNIMLIDKDSLGGSLDV